MWESVVPSMTWVEEHVPPDIRLHCLVSPPDNSNLDYETINQAYCNIIAGSCFILGLRFVRAGPIPGLQLVKMETVFSHLSTPTCVSSSLLR